MGERPGPAPLPHFLTGGGAAARLIADHDWAATALGPIAGWPVSLRTAVALVLRAPSPMTLLWSPEGVMIYNDGYAEICGARHPAALGSRALESWPELAAFNAEVIRRTLAGESLAYADLALEVQRNGRAEPAWFTLQYTPAPGDDGRPAGALALVFETTAKVLADQWRQGESERLLRMFEQAPGFMAMLRGPQHVFELANPAYLKLVGQRDLLGRTVREALPEIEGQGTLELLDRVFASGEAVTGVAVEVAIQADPGAPPMSRYIDVVYQPMRARDGTVTGVFVQGSDVTERVAGAREAAEQETRNRAEQQLAAEALRESEGRLRRAQEAGRIGTFSLDLATDDLSVTPEFCRIFGLEPVAVLPAARVERLVLPEDRPISADAARHGDRDAALGVEYRIRRGGDGSLRWIARHGEFEVDAQGRALRLLGTVRDITIRKQAELAAQQSAEQFRVFAEALPNHVWTARPDGVLDWFNTRVHEYARLAPGTLDDAGWKGLVHPDEAATTAERWRSALASGRDYEHEFRLRRGDGDYRWHLVRALALRAPDGTITRWIGTNTDIHDNKLAQAETARDRNRIWTLSRELMLVCDFGGRIAAVNPAAQRLLGWTEAEMVGRSLAEFVHPADLAATAGEVDRLAGGATTLAFENRYRAKDGAYLLLNWTAVPDGGLIHAVARDITVERASMLERERVLTATNDLMGTVGSDGVLRAVNPAWQHMLGHTDAALLGRPLRDYVDPVDQARFDAVARRLRGGASIENVELRLRDARDRPVLVAWAIRAVGDFAYLVGRNVTEQRLAEEALRQSQKMEAVGQLTGGIAHDFNNLLTVIQTSIDLMRRPTLTEARRQRSMESISNAVKRAARLTGQLLAFARRQALQPVVFDAARNVTSIVEMIRTLVGSRIRVDVEVPDQTCEVDADPGQLDTAIVNMVVNARDAMNGAGRLAIRTSRVDGIPSSRAQPAVAGAYVAIAVTDTGSGIEAERLDRVFEPFYTTKAVGHGTGLGLSQVFGFAKQSGGDVQVVSELGVGTTFTIYLPSTARAAAEQAAAAPELEADERGAGRVLVVEDNADVAASVEVALADLGYDVAVVHSGEAALALLASDPTPYNAVFSDVVMPGMDGVELGREIRRRHGALPVLLSSGYSHVLASTVDLEFPLLPKPYPFTALARALRDVIGRRDDPIRRGVDADDYARRSGETTRQAELDALDVLDTDAEEAYDELTRLAATLFDAPIALVSLVDADRQWFKSRVGLHASETAREHAFCAHAIEAPGQVMVVSDASQDPRFAHNPLVTGDPNIRFYAGAPLVTRAGHALGTLCVIDTQARVANPQRLEALQVLAREVVERLEARRGRPE